jgi:predicted nucleic acid-binding protein
VTEPEQFRRPRLVVDPNVLVAAAISSQGAPALLLQLVEAGAAVMVVSPLLLQEAGEVLRRRSSAVGSPWSTSRSTSKR